MLVGFVRQLIISSADAEMRRQLLAEHIVAMIRAVNTTKTSESLNWIEEVALPILARVAYCKDDSSPPISDKTRQRFRASLMSVFTHVLSDFGGFSYSCNLVLNLTPDAVPMDEDLAKVNGEALSIMKKLLKKGKSESAESKAPRQALALLYSLVIIQLYNGEPDAVSVLEELKLCRDKLVKHGETKDSDIDASEVLVELLLSFISRPSALLRKATQHVFSAFIEKVTAGGLKLMTDVLESSEGLRGQQELFDQEPEDGEDVDMDDNDAEMDSDVEIVDMDADDGQFNSHLKLPSDDDLDSDSGDSESTSGESEADPEDEALNTALAQILGTSNNDAGADAEESDSDADMTDSEMMALDSKLVEIFSQRKKAPNKKQEQKDAKETMINFKSRVLDLLEIYVKKQAANPLAFGLLQPLLQLMRTTKTKPLAEKASLIIQMFFKSFKAAKKADSSLSSSKVFAATQLELLKAIHAEVSKDPSHMFAKAASTASLLVASSLLHADKDNIQDSASVYCDSQVRLVRGEARIQASFFVEWINWCQSLARP
jgi:DNA polymerase phi